MGGGGRSGGDPPCMSMGSTRAMCSGEGSLQLAICCSARDKPEGLGLGNQESREGLRTGSIVHIFDIIFISILCFLLTHILHFFPAIQICYIFLCNSFSSCWAFCCCFWFCFVLADRKSFAFLIVIVEDF